MLCELLLFVMLHIIFYSIHGLTGMSMLSILSFITMFGVYVGGLCTAATLRSYVALIEGAAKQTKG